MLPKPSSLLQILLLLALVVSLTASPMEMPDDDDETSSKGKEKELKDMEKGFFANGAVQRLLNKAGTMTLPTVLGGIICDKETLGKFACPAPERYGDANDMDPFRENYPETGFLHFIYKCVTMKRDDWFQGAFYWERKRCEVDTFCGVQRFQKNRNKKVETKTQTVQVLCMGEGELKGEKVKGNKNWVNANPGMDKEKMNKLLGSRVRYINQFTVTDHPDVKKSDAINLGLVIKTGKYKELLKEWSNEEKKPQHIEPKTPKMKIVQTFANLGAKIGISNKEKEPEKRDSQGKGSDKQ